MDSVKDRFKNINEGIYVVDKNFEMVYMDENLASVYQDADPSPFCYKVLRNRSTPCPNCPLGRFKQKKSTVLNEIIYNDLLDCWMYCTMMRMNWPAKGECTVVTTERIIDGDHNLFMNFNHTIKYEELIEINLSDHTYKLLFDQTKHFPAKQCGNFHELLTETSLRFLHYEDRKNFHEFFDPLTLRQRVEKLGHIVDDFRILQDGEYHWISFYVNSVKKGRKDECYLCFTVNADRKYGTVQKQYEESLLQQRDVLTGLQSAAAFQKNVENRLKDSQESYGLVMIDIEHFKLFNDWYGTKQGDKLLVYIGEKVEEKCRAYHGIASRYGGDEFVMLLPRCACEEAEIEKEIIDWMQNYQKDIKFMPTAGIYLIDEDISATLMCDRAAMALHSVKGNYSKRAALYRPSMKQKLENEQEVLSGVKSGLSGSEFEVYYQPQCSARTHRIIGAEALVRWNHPRKGMVAPNEFIPLLEASGFVSKLDYYVWESVCSFLQRRKKAGKQLVPVSVNVSRIDIYQYPIADVFASLCRKYDLEPAFLEIEITESAYTENFDQLIQTVSQLRANGFTVLMDDFGSGYSSLNMLKDIEVDVLKLDMKFLDLNENSLLKGSSILESMIQMGKWLGLRLIAEGVETAEQLDKLLNLDCEYMQGYYFYRPMPQSDFESLLNQENLIDVRGIRAKRLPTINLEDLFHKDITSEAMLNNILGGIALYELKGEDQFTIKMVNDKYYRMTGCNAVDLMERSEHIINQVHKDDLAIFKKIFADAETSSIRGAEGIFRRYRLNGEIMWMKLHAFFLRKQGDTKIFYGSVTDCSEKMRLEKEFQMVLDAIPGNIVEYRVKDGKTISRVICSGLSNRFGYSKAEFEELLVNHCGFVYVHEDDVDSVKQAIGNPAQWGDYVSCMYRGITKDGNYIWLEQRITLVGREDGESVYNSLCTEITREVHSL